ncbi:MULTISPECIES: efflux RND transporter periplasmic adaptor subunit [unclassified Aureimonas]|uniref:efflux RND transporter periplasmic adaptor subunit n=1 Tax=unclassified Aureimonas TaxID=2615206 RepID=UPI0006F1C837|nr:MULTISPECIES: efflux RND transporter periplasmic adaptor subunit [unclassified Aureimonas]KQT61251.1 hemolysin secretion protein D [Aureimonas sp. Leaf460]KQT68700.1 hemolysin secretion protein D [Aureimonas sp. Leaf427]
MKRLALLGSLLAAASALAACQGEEEAPPPPVRPVLSVVVAPQVQEQAGYTGIVEPRFSRDLGFRILGRMVAREVDIGQDVKKGQLLASLDPTAVALTVRQLEAEYAKAEAQLVNASATRQRQQALVERRVNSQAELDQAEQARASADSAVLRGRAALDKAREQLSYSRLISDTDGVVTAVGAEVGQTVTPGQTVVTVAQAEVREAVVDIPDEVAQRLSEGDRFETALQVDPKIVAEGMIREIAPEADAATRTRRVRITLDDLPPAFRIGTTVTARQKVKDLQSIDLPRTALLEEGGKSFVFVVDEAASKVVRRPVEIDGLAGSLFRIKSGIDIGARVVTAGVHTLKDGDPIKLGEEIAP